MARPKWNELNPERKPADRRTMAERAKAGETIDFRTHPLNSAVKEFADGSIWHGHMTYRTLREWNIEMEYRADEIDHEMYGRGNDSTM